MSRFAFIWGLLVSVLWSLPAQESPRNPDPEATELLVMLEKKFHESNSVLYEFSLTLDFPDQDPVVQEGTYLQSATKYRLEVSDYSFVTDGITQWVIDHPSKEIQLHDYTQPSENELSTPQSLLKIYTNPNFDYRLLESQSSEQHLVEFKPLKKGSDYIKARLKLNTTDHMIQEIELFNRDGSKFILAIHKVSFNTSFDTSSFRIDPVIYPGYHVEDLRIE
ncbi:MAG: outer membrane lipoprotein carrier protein LolA [Saprospiraceae bacterium]|nr:outer membrane lipoprotein carrier protein LolA [Saprospiraceae bacterium]